MFRISRPFREEGALDQLDAVTIEIGRDESSIRAVAYADGRVGLNLGTGQEFVGCCRDLPLRVVESARILLDVAQQFVGLLPPEEPGNLPRRALVRITLRTPTAVFADGSSIRELKNGRSRLAPLWTAFADLLAPLISVLFESPVSPDDAEPDIPALARARRLLSQVDFNSHPG